MSNEDLTSWISSSLVKLSCLTPKLLRGFDRSLKVAQRKSKQVERYKQKVDDKDQEIRHLKQQVKNLKKIVEKNDLSTLKIKHQSEMSALKTCLLQDVEAQLEYKDRLLVEGVTELDSLEGLLVAERVSHSAKEQLWVEERRSVEELLVAEREGCSIKEQMWVKERQALKDSICSLQSRVDLYWLNNYRLASDRKWLISEGFAHAINKVHCSDEFTKPYVDCFCFAWFVGVQEGLKSAYSHSAKGFPIEKLDFYHPGVIGKLNLVYKWLENRRFPYVEKLSSMVDQPLNVIRGLEPERKLTSKGSNTGATKRKTMSYVTNFVDDYLKQHEPGHVT